MLKQVKMDQTPKGATQRHTIHGRQSDIFGSKSFPFQYFWVMKVFKTEV